MHTDPSLLNSFDTAYDGIHEHMRFVGIDRINAFAVIGKYPYLFNDYLENINFRALDPASMSNGIILTTNKINHMFVDVHMNDTVPLIGNKQKYESLVDALYFYVRKKHHNVLPVIQHKLVVQISYQLENYYTGEILRSTQERLVIKDFEYYMKDNLPGLANNDLDSAIVTKFMDSITNSVNDVVHGANTILCRITKIETFYPAVINNYYHYSYPPKHVPWNTDPRWYESRPLPNFNHRCNNLYHFSDGGKNIQLHREEIEHLACENISLVPLQSLKLDQTFLTSLGSRITFRFHIWRSDITMIRDSSHIESILGGAPRRTMDKSIEDILDKIDDIKDTDFMQSTKIHELHSQLNTHMTEDDVDAMMGRLFK